MPSHVEPSGDASVKPLPDRFRRHGYDFVFVERRGRVAIFAQCAAGRVAAYEVAVIRLQKARPAVRGSPQNEDLSRLSERYPSDADWGKYGFTYSTFGGQVSAATALEHARARMRELLAKESSRSGTVSRGDSPGDAFPPA